MPQPPDAPAGVWGEFPNTVLHFTDDPSFKIDLREPVTPAHQAHFAVLGLERTFAVISAQDPQGQTLGPQENQILAVKLQRELTAMHTAYVSLDACSPDHAHCEASVAVSLSQDEAIALARRHEQLALFWFDGTRFWIVPALSSNPSVSLPVCLISQSSQT